MGVFLIALQTAVAAASESGQPTPGTLITSDNAGSYARYLPAAARFALEHGFRIRVSPSKRLEWSSGYKHATEQYSPQVSLDDKDHLVNYVAGMPFPLINPADPKAAVKIAHDWHMGPFMPDDFSLAPWSSNGYSIDPENRKLAVPREDKDYSCVEFDFLRFAHRTEVEPRPALAANAMGVEWKARCTTWAKTALGTSSDAAASFWIRFLDPDRDDEAYIFLESSRRLRRIAGLGYPNEQCRSCHQPYWAYALPKTERYSYRLLGTRALLACIDAPEEPAGLRPSAQGSFEEEPFELRHTYTIEMTPHDGHSNQRVIIDIDSEIYVWLAAEFFEGAERTATAIPLWRRRPSAEGGSLFDLAGSFYVPEAAPSFFRSLTPAHGGFEQKINTGNIEPAFFNPQRTAR